MKAQAGLLFVVLLLAGCTAESSSAPATARPSEGPNVAQNNTTTPFVVRLHLLANGTLTLSNVTESAAKRTPVVMIPTAPHQARARWTLALASPVRILKATAYVWVETTEATLSAAVPAVATAQGGCYWSSTIQMFDACTRGSPILVTPGTARFELSHRLPAAGFTATARLDLVIVGTIFSPEASPRAFVLSSSPEKDSYIDLTVASTPIVA